MKTKFPLFSFCVLSYNNYQYIKETLDSLFIQTYPNIELIVTNDGSPDFDIQDLTQYIDAHKDDNIKNVLLNNNETNLGTVKNINFAQKNAKGDFIMYMAADDALYDETVLQRFVDAFERLGEDAMLVSAKTAMCSHQLDDVISYEPSEEGIKAITEMDSHQMFSRLTHTFTIPTTSTCYRTRLYELTGPYDEDYYIIEDAPLYIKLARIGVKFHWIDDLVGARHRDGGVSHGNTLNLSEGYRRYRYDEIVFFKKEVLPYKKKVLPADWKLAMDKWNYVQKTYDDTFVRPFLTPRQKMVRRLRHAPWILMHLLHRAIQLPISYLLNPQLAKGVLTAAAASGSFFLLALVLAGMGVTLLPMTMLWFLLWISRISILVWAIMLGVRLLSLAWRGLRFIILGKPF